MTDIVIRPAQAADAAGIAALSRCPGNLALGAIRLSINFVGTSPAHRQSVATRLVQAAEEWGRTREPPSRMRHLVRQRAKV